MRYRYLDRIRDTLAGLGTDDLYLFLASYGEKSGNPHYWTNKVFKANGAALEFTSDNPFKTVVSRAVSNNRMVSCSVALFGPALNDKGHIARTVDNAHYIYDVFVDVDNDEYKALKKTTLKDASYDDRLKAIRETQEKLFLSIIGTLTDMGLSQYATIIRTGAGYHIHFFLREAFSLKSNHSKIENMPLNGLELYKDILKILNRIFKSDDSKLDPSAMAKYLPGTFYYKEEAPIPVECQADAETFLSFMELRDKILAYKPKTQPIEGSRNNTDPLLTYNGPSEYENNDGTKIVITKDYKMYVKRITKKMDEDGNRLWSTEPISSGSAIIPRYMVKHNVEEEEEDPGATASITYIFEAINASESKIISIPLSCFDTPDKLQKRFVDFNIDISIGGLRGTFLSYAKTHSKSIKAVDIGVYSHMIVHYDYIYIIRTGTYHKAHGNLVKIGDQVYYINGREYRKENLKDKTSARKIQDGYFKTDSSYNETLKEYLAKARGIFKDDKKTKLFLSYMAAAMIRDKIIDQFKEFPILNLYGEGGTGKSTLLMTAVNIFNIAEIVAAPTIYNIYKKQENIRNMIIPLDDVDDLDKYREFLKNCVTNAVRSRKTIEGRDNPEIRNAVMISTNHSIQDDAVNSRVIKMWMTKENMIEDDRAYFDYDNFVENRKTELFFALAEAVGKIDWNELIQKVTEYAKYISVKVKDIRLAKLYSLIICVGSYLDIGMDDVLEFTETIETTEKAYGTDKQAIISELVEFVLIKESKEREDWSLKDRISKEYKVHFNEFTRHLVEIAFDERVTGKKVSKWLRNYSFIKSEHTTWKGRNGKHLVMDFSQSQWSDYFEQVNSDYVAIKAS